MPIRPIRRDTATVAGVPLPSPVIIPSPTPRRRRAPTLTPAEWCAPAPQLANPIREHSPARQPPTPRAKPKPRTKSKRQPSGDYPIGYCRTPVETRFQIGNPGGPGRPKGSRSQDSIMRRELEKKRRVRIDGREQLISLREFMPKLLTKRAVEKQDLRPIMYFMGEASRLFPEAPGTAATAHAAIDPAFEAAVLSGLFDAFAAGEPAVLGGPTFTLADFEIADFRGGRPASNDQSPANDLADGDDLAEPPI